MQVIPPDIASLADYERYAQARLPGPVWAYLAGAAADGITMRDNRDAFDRIRLKGRVLADMRGASAASALFAEVLPFPVLVAPMAYQRLAHPEGEHALALGAAAAGVPAVVSTQASIGLEEIARQAQGPLWFQLYPQPERERTLTLLQRAEAAGYRAIVVTVDAPLNGIRNAEQRAGFRLPDGVSAVNLEGDDGPAVSRAKPGQSPVFRGLLDHAPHWDDIAWLRKQTRLPLLLKGITDPDDAARGEALGADGIIVSNHGGRVLDTLPASIDLLPAIATRLGGRLPILLDGGIRRGTDVLKALALGAKAVLVGRPLCFALAVAGSSGVAHALTILAAEFEATMALTGHRTVADIGRGAIADPTGVYRIQTQHPEMEFSA